tara:strand:- start:1771 stop:2187 length:417 start_codon:yes stop_codon:yes gene_type:complete
MALTYTLAADQTETDPQKQIIEKRGHVVTFTLDQVDSHILELRKHIKEITSKCDYEKAKMTNIEEHHDYVKEMDDEKRFTVHMYQDARATVKLCEVKLKEIEKQIEEYAAEVLDIIKQVPEIGPSIPAIAVEDTHVSE